MVGLELNSNYHKQQVFTRLCTATLKFSSFIPKLKSTLSMNSPSDVTEKIDQSQ